MINKMFCSRSSLMMLLLGLISINPVLGASVTIQLIADLPKERKQNMQENLSLYQIRNSPLLNEDYIESLKTEGVTELQTMLQTFGYYKPNVTVSSTQQNGNFNVTYNIELGPPVKVDNVNIQVQGEGNQDQQIKRWIKNYPLTRGDVLSHTQYEKAKRSLLQLLRDRGYFSAALQTHQVAVNLDTLSADINLAVDTGPRYRFGETRYIQENYDLGYLERFLPYSQGEEFDSEQLVELQQRLTKSREFLSVEINPEIAQAGENHRVPITVRLTPRKRWRFSLGLGYGTDVGVEASGSVFQRGFTRRGHQIGAEASLAETKQEASVIYTIPAKKPWSDYYALSYGFTHELTDDTERYTNEVTPRAVYELDDLRHILSLSFEDEQFLVGDTKSRSKVLVPSWATHYDPGRNEVLDRLDFDMYVELRGSEEKLASDVSFTQIISRGDLRYDLSQHWTAVSRYEIGFTDIADFEELPVSYRFFAGGDYSVRGYDYHSLSPVDEEGNNVGGRNILVGSLEMQYRFLQNWDVATFFDIGNAYDIGNTDLKQGAGFGLGWHYSLLSIRAYAANALDISDRPWKYHVLIGADL